MPSSSIEREARILITSSEPVPNSDIATSKACNIFISSVPSALSPINSEATRLANSSAPNPSSITCNKADSPMKSPPNAVSIMPKVTAISGVSTPVATSANEN